MRLGDCVNNHKTIKVFICIGTRADIIKMSPIINKLKHNEIFSCHVSLSGQHKELASIALNDLNIQFDSKFDVMKPGQTLSALFSVMLNNYSDAITAYSPDVVLVHGDTSTAFAGAMSAKYLHIPVMHIEAGLRTYSNMPFPEELHRRIITHCSSLFACPDIVAKNNLISEGIAPEKICITGNTIADVVYSTVNEQYCFKEKKLQEFDYNKYKEIVVTLHRSETDEIALKNVCNSLKELEASRDDVYIFWPVHPNPRIKNLVMMQLSNVNNVTLLEPLSVRDMHNLLLRSSLVITDSAGIQEETYLLEKPTLILREVSERPGYINSFISKYFSPLDEELTSEMIKALKLTRKETDFSVTNKLFTHTGATRKIISFLKRFFYE